MALITLGQAMALVIGLISGTSADGVDAALVRIDGGAQASGIRLEASLTYPYPAGLREAIWHASEAHTGSVDLLCRLNVVLGEVFAEAALAVTRQADVALHAIDLIGSHGQTVQHLPQPSALAGYAVRATLQLGEPCVIAERTGVTTVADFRHRDMAAGGEGAPLAPYGHYLLFKDAQHTRVVHNIGGISNVTLLPAAGSLADVIAFDTGPGNMLIDGLVSLLTQGREPFDKDGQWARQGQIHHAWLRELLTHPFLRRPPPKSTGRETFGKMVVEELFRRSIQLALSPADVLATVTAFSAATMVDAYRRFILPRHPHLEGILCGGGSRNPTLIGHLRQELPEVTWRSSDEFGLSADALEAVIFAILAYETMAGRPANVPSATGARHAVVMGKIVPGQEGWKDLALRL
jgi:anhydro-N-acetylmuramic acid kinase